MTTEEKEKSGLSLVTSNLDKIFPGNTGYRLISDKKMQLAGVDFEVYFGDTTWYIDLKSCIGPDYSMTSSDYIDKPARLVHSKAIPLEVSQYGEITCTKGKLTDFFLYVVQDRDGAGYKLLAYADAIRIVRKHLASPVYTEHTSFNGTGVYIKIPVSLSPL